MLPVDPDVDLGQILAQPALERLSVIETGCFDEVMAAYADLTPDELLAGGQLPDALVAKFAESNPGQEGGQLARPARPGPERRHDPG